MVIAIDIKFTCHCYYYLAAFAQQELPGQGPIFLSIQSCSGNEQTLLDCFHEQFDDIDQPCSHNQDLSISCITEAEAGNNNFNQQIESVN